MNKKGFTLTELILTIGLLAVIGLVIVTNMSGLLEKNKEDNYQNFVKAIEEAACTYIELKTARTYLNIDECKTTGCTIKVKKIVEEGLLTEEEIISPKTNQSVAENNVSITYPNKKKTCQFVE